MLDAPLPDEVVRALPYQYLKPVSNTIFFFVIPSATDSPSQIQEIKDNLLLKPAVVFDEDFKDWDRLNSSFVIITSAEAAMKWPLDLNDFRTRFLHGTNFWEVPHVYNNGMVFFSHFSESPYAFNKTHSKKGWRVVADIPFGTRKEKIANYFEVNREIDVNRPESCSDLEEFCCLPETFQANTPFWIGLTPDVKSYVETEPRSDRSSIRRLHELINRTKEYRVCQKFIRLMTNYAWYGISEIKHLHHIYPDKEPPSRKPGGYSIRPTRSNSPKPTQE